MNEKVDDHFENYKLKTQRRSPGQKAADLLTGFCGSWYFVLMLFGYLLMWIFLNEIILMEGWDPYPFILLNFTLSCMAVLQSSIVLMSQKREEEKHTLRVEYDYAVNRKAEKEIQEVKRELDEIKQMLKKR